MSRRPRSSGFTLVELLVVIGIIALLISILLPSLNKARKQANLVYCQSQLRQIYQAVLIYANESKGSMPWGRVTADVNGSTVTYFDYSTKWPYDWTDTISLAMGAKLNVNNFPAIPADKAKVFRDLDTVDDPGVSPWPYNSMPVNHYVANSRIFADPSRFDENTQALFKQRKFSSIKKAAETMAIWDGGQQLTSATGSLAGSCWPTSDNIDQYRTGWAHCLQEPPPASQGTWYNGYTDLLALGTIYGNTLADVKLANVDAPFSYNPVNLMRFRHMSNDTGNFCFADGHVESRKIGTVVVRDVCLKLQ